MTSGSHLTPIADWRDPAQYPSADAPLRFWGWEFLRRNSEYRKWWPDAYNRFLEYRKTQKARYITDPHADWDEFGEPSGLRHVDEPGPLPDGLADGDEVERIVWAVMRRAGEDDLWGLEIAPNPITGYCLPEVRIGVPEGGPPYTLTIDPHEPEALVVRRAKQMHKEARYVYGVDNQRNQPKIWTRYLQLLDAEVDGAQNPAIAKHIYVKDYDESVRKQKADDLPIAHSMVESGFRHLLYAPPLEYNPELL